MGDARIMTLDFAKAQSIRLHKSGKIRDRGTAADHRPITAEGKLLTPRQIRARARRQAAKTSKKARHQPVMSEVEFEALYKPIDDWDLEELARGRPRGSDGTFKGRKPGWITREVHERAMEQFQLSLKMEMSTQSITALDTLRYILDNEDTDDRGKPLVPASVKLQATTFLLEHQVGKPKQQIQQDISVKLQGILGAVMVNPNDALAPAEQGGMGNFSLAHMPGYTLPLGIASADGDEEEEFDDV